MVMEFLDLTIAAAGGGDDGMEEPEMYWIVGPVPGTSRYLFCTTVTHAVGLWDLYERRCVRIIDTGIDLNWRWLMIISVTHWLTHWGRVTHICVIKLIIIGSEIGLSPGRRQAIFWTNDGLLLIRNLGTNFSEILGKIHSYSLKKMHLKMSSAKGRLSSLSLNELNLTNRVFFMPAIENYMLCNET